jgi:hypothetical protein
MTAADAPHVAKVVARGAALLDDEIPGWAARVNLSVLDVSDCTRCVLGQLFAEDDPDSPYGWGLHELGLDSLSDAAYGFEQSDNYDHDYDDLTVEWRRVIAARQEAQRRLDAQGGAS